MWVDDTLERVVRRDRTVIAIALALVIGIGWWYLVSLVSGMSGPTMPARMAMPHVGQWSSLQPIALFTMWSVMMVAMMLPSAAPMILLFAAIARRRRARASPTAPTALFVAGYLLVWTGFSIVAVLAQITLHRAALLSPEMATTSRIVGGVLLLAAGLYQWAPLKQHCLTSCRSPLAFLGSSWREGQLGAFAMGIEHGSYCLGCCWALMALLFVAGVMNLLWIATLGAVVLIEKMLPRGLAIGRVAGVMFGAWGIVLLTRAA